MEDEGLCYDVESSGPTTITVGGKHQLTSRKRGAVRLRGFFRGKYTLFLLGGVRILPGFGRNIIAEGKLLDAGFRITKSGNTMEITTANGEPFIQLQSGPGGLFNLKADVVVLR